MRPTLLAPTDLLPVLDLPRIPTQRRSHNKRERLLIAALAVFQTQGYYLATVDAITAQAKLSTGTFNRYVQEKRHLLLMLVGEQLDFLAEELEAFEAFSGPVAALEQLVRALFGADGVSRGVWKDWKEASAHDAELAASHRKINAKVQDALVAPLDRVEEQERLRPDLDRRATARAVTALLWGIMDKDEHADEVVRAAARMLYHALFVDRSGPGRAKLDPG